MKFSDAPLDANLVVTPEWLSQALSQGRSPVTVTKVVLAGMVSRIKTSGRATPSTVRVKGTGAAVPVLLSESV